MTYYKTHMIKRTSSNKFVAYRQSCWIIGTFNNINNAIKALDK